MSNNLIQNSFQVPNAYIDRLMPLLTDGEFRVLMVSLRHHGRPMGLQDFVQALGREAHAVAAALNGLLRYGAMEMEKLGQHHVFYIPNEPSEFFEASSLRLEGVTLLPNRTDDELDVQEYALLARYLHACGGGRETCTERANADEEETTRYARQRLAEKGWIEVRN